MKELTKEQHRVFSFIQSFIRENNTPPTVREIAGGMGYRSINSARQHLRLISSKGYLRLHPGRARGIEVVKGFAAPESGSGVERDAEATSPSPGSGGISVPLVGSIAAGTPITAIENIENHITLDPELFGRGELFTLRVHGDSMSGIGIFDMDIVVIRQQDTADNGDVIAVILGDEATLKRYERTEEAVILHPENPAYSDIVIPDSHNVNVAGKMVGVIRRY
ncbi:MAG: transcriptional repressor LexA [Chitinivibrionales bacterium]